MPVVLLLVGVITTAAGLLLVGAGLTVRDGSFNTEVLTPGTIATVGGLLLVAFALAVRELQRIERALIAPPVTLAEETAAAEERVDLALPSPAVAAEKAELEPPPPAAEAPADETIEQLPPRIPVLARAENGALLEAADVSVALREAAGLQVGAAALKSAAAGGGGRTANGPAPVRMVPRGDAARPRPAMTVGKTRVSVFNTLWPAPSGRDEQNASGRPVPTSEPSSAQPAATWSSANIAPVSVLKSGVVEGLAYTLYSDGSIEAQLPQGTLRFGSISALRSHIENSP